MGYNDEIVIFLVIGVEYKIICCLIFNVLFCVFYIGYLVVVVVDGRIVIIGGGVMCFFMGIFWNKGVYFLCLLGFGIIGVFFYWIYDKIVDIILGEWSFFI